MTRLLTGFILALMCSSLASAQQHLYGRWENKSINDSGTETTLIYDFRANNVVILERKIRSDKHGFSSHIAVEGNWSLTSFTEDQRIALAQQYSLIRWYRELQGDELISFRKINMKFHKVVSCVAKKDDGTILEREQNSLIENFKNISLSEIVPAQNFKTHLVLISLVENEAEGVVFEKVE